MLTYMSQHADAWQGVTYWAGGPWWPPDYMFLIEPQGGVDKPQMAILVNHLSSVGFFPEHAGTIVYTTEYGVAPSATELNVSQSACRSADFDLAAIARRAAPSQLYFLVSIMSSSRSS
jgi:hypothetical protein